MQKKVVEIFFKNNVYSVIYDYKVKLECGHFSWLWSFKGDPIGYMQSCFKCGDPNKLEIWK